jgi:hydrogenase maturation protease
MATIIIGMGNPVLSDDSVGVKIAQELQRRLAGDNGITAVELHTGGMRLVETMAGYDRAFVIDAIVSGEPAGTIHKLNLADLPKTRFAHSSHDGNLGVAFEFARAVGLRLPSEIRIWAIEAADVATFGEKLTPFVERAAAQVTGEVLRLARRGPRPTLPLRRWRQSTSQSLQRRGE